MTEIVVVGCGGVGLAFAAAQASRGGHVIGVDTNAELVQRLNAGEVESLDAGVAPGFGAALTSGELTFTVATLPARHARAWVIATPTPVGVDLQLDDRSIRSAFSAICEQAQPGDLVMIRSTTPVGFTRALASQAGARGLLFASCPDRSQAGEAYAEQLRIPHIVGGLGEAASRAAEAVLRPLGKVITLSSPEAAEALKLCANTWRDAQFAIANQLAQFCLAANLDFDEIRAAGAEDFDRFKVPRAGPVGGPCLTKDVHLLAQSARTFGGDVPLLLEVRRFNEGLIEQVVEAIQDEGRAVRQPLRVAILGLAFKGRPAVHDRRGSAGAALLHRLRQVLPDARIRAWDPVVALSGDDGEDVAIDADVVVLANDHPGLADPGRLEGCAAGALVYDLCGVLRGPVRADLRLRRLGASRRS